MKMTHVKNFNEFSCVKRADNRHCDAQQSSDETTDSPMIEAIFTQCWHYQRVHSIYLNLKYLFYYVVFHGL